MCPQPKEESRGVGSCVSDYSEECDADAHDGAVSSSHQMVSRKYYSISTTDHKVVFVQKYHGIFVTAALSNGAQLWCEYATTATIFYTILHFMAILHCTILHYTTLHYKKI